MTNELRLTDGEILQIATTGRWLTNYELMPYLDAQLAKLQPALEQARREERERIFALAEDYDNLTWPKFCLRYGLNAVEADDWSLVEILKIVSQRG